MSQLKHTDQERVSVIQAAEILGVSKYSVRAFMRKGYLPFYKLGRRVVLSRQDIENFLAKNRRETKEEA